MAEIATYQCNNLKCRYVVRVSREFPVWHPETPTSLRALKPSHDSLPYIVKYRSELFCHNCRKIIDHSGTTLCNLCGADDVREEQAGKACAQCPKGVFVMTKIIVY